MLQNYFDKVFMINLDSAKDRLERATRNCKRVGIEFERIKATPGKSKYVKMNKEPYEGWNRNASGLAYTTVKIIKKAKKEGWKNVFIMEDDVDFVSNNFKEILEKTVKKLPANWEFFHLNSTHKYTSKWVGSCLHRLGGAWCCQAYAVNHTIYDKYLLDLQQYDQPIDEITLSIHKNRQNSYCTVPNLVIHREGNYSTLRDMRVDY